MIELHCVSPLKLWVKSDYLALAMTMDAMVIILVILRCLSDRLMIIFEGPDE